MAAPLELGMLTPPAHCVPKKDVTDKCKQLMRQLKSAESICTDMTQNIAEVIRVCLHARGGYNQLGQCAPSRSPSELETADFLERVVQLATHLSKVFVEESEVLCPHLHLLPIADVSYPSPFSYR